MPMTRPDIRWPGNRAPTSNIAARTARVHRPGRRIDLLDDRENITSAWRAASPCRFIRAKCEPWPRRYSIPTEPWYIWQSADGRDMLKSPRSSVRRQAQSQLWCGTSSFWDLPARRRRRACRKIARQVEVDRPTSGVRFTHPGGNFVTSSAGVEYVRAGLSCTGSIGTRIRHRHDRHATASGLLAHHAAQAKVVNWARAARSWPMPFATACCGIELMATGASRYAVDISGASAPRRCGFSSRGRADPADRRRPGHD